MPVGIVFSSTNGGSTITDLDCGNVSNGAETSAQTVYVRHDGVNSITSVKLYIQAYTGSYTGGATALEDYAELISWGDATNALSWGGLLINMDATGGFPSSAWPTLASKSPTYGICHRTGVADSSANAVTISSRTGATADGTIQAGSSPNVRFQAKVVVPPNEDTVGIRLFEQKILYSYTS